MDYAYGGWKLKDVNLLCIETSYDADQFVYTALDHYHALEFSQQASLQYFMKAGLYVGHANHGQFNSEWGDTDVALSPTNWFLSRGSLVKRTLHLLTFFSSS